MSTDKNQEKEAQKKPKKKKPKLIFFPSIIHADCGKQQIIRSIYAASPKKKNIGVHTAEKGLSLHTFMVIPL